MRKIIKKVTIIYFIVVVVLCLLLLFLNPSATTYAIIAFNTFMAFVVYRKVFKRKKHELDRKKVVVHTFDANELEKPKSIAPK